MFNATAFAKKVLERRKAQGLTQDQLGSELGVSGQSVSKWENCESLPDTSLIPPLCKALGVSADDLLSVDCGVGVENLSREIAHRLNTMKDGRNEALLRVLRQLMLLGREEPPDHASKVTNTVDCQWKSGELFILNLFKTNGLACFAMKDVLQVDGPSLVEMERLRLLLEAVPWEVAMQLLRGGKKEQALVEACNGLGADVVRDALSKMIEAGLVILDRTGYHLEPQSGLVWAGFIKAICANEGNIGFSTFFNNIVP